MIAQYSHIHLNTFCLQRTNNLISILQQERNLIITKYMCTPCFTVHIDISGKNADYIKKRSPILSHRIFTAVQNIFIIHLYKTKCFNITSSSTHRICRLWLYQINVCLIVGRNSCTTVCCSRNSYSVSCTYRASRIDIQFHRSRLLFTSLHCNLTTIS